MYPFASVLGQLTKRLMKDSPSIHLQIITCRSTLHLIQAEVSSVYLTIMNEVLPTVARVGIITEQESGVQ